MIFAWPIAWAIGMGVGGIVLTSKRRPPAQPPDELDKFELPEELDQFELPDEDEQKQEGDFCPMGGIDCASWDPSLTVKGIMIDAQEAVLELLGDALVAFWTTEPPELPIAPSLRGELFVGGLYRYQGDPNDWVAYKQWAAAALAMAGLDAAGFPCLPFAFASNSLPGGGCQTGVPLNNPPVDPKTPNEALGALFSYSYDFLFGPPP